MFGSVIWFSNGNTRLELPLRAQRACHYTGRPMHDTITVNEFREWPAGQCERYQGRSNVCEDHAFGSTDQHVFNHHGFIRCSCAHQFNFACDDPELGRTTLEMVYHCRHCDIVSRTVMLERLSECGKFVRPQQLFLQRNMSKNSPLICKKTPNPNGEASVVTTILDADFKSASKEDGLLMA